MMLNSTKGMAISFSALMKMVPKGAIQSCVNEAPLQYALARAQPMPRSMPRMILVCNFMSCVDLMALGQVHIGEHEGRHGLHDGQCPR